jgi:hypothetical protein
MMLRESWLASSPTYFAWFVSSMFTIFPCKGPHTSPEGWAEAMAVRGSAVTSPASKEKTKTRRTSVGWYRAGSLACNGDST